MSPTSAPFIIHEGQCFFEVQSTEEWAGRYFNTYVNHKLSPVSKGIQVLTRWITAAKPELRWATVSRIQIEQMQDCAKPVMSRVRSLRDTRVLDDQSSV